MRTRGEPLTSMHDENAEDGVDEKISLLIDSIDNVNQLDREHFFQGTFHAAFKLIPEAQKGSLYELRDGRYVPVYAQGYDMSLLSRLSFAPEEAFIDFECRDTERIVAYESRIERRDDSAFSAETIATFKELGTYADFVSLHAPIQIAGRNIGIICLENFEGRGFSVMSKKILSYYARLISSYYSAWKRIDERNRLVSERMESLRRIAAGLAHELNTPLGAL
ncbi:MAG TPA: hypothetical protein VMC79_13380, partial [Rectinemataceae bacterium]|nr:hypothetical protein [Rectinemataceae bacterium]